MAPDSRAVRFEGVARRFGRDSVLDGVDLDVRAGSYTVLLGGPASGKSTLLRVLMGLDKPDAGRVRLRGEDVTASKPGARNIGYVPQSFALYPHYSVYDNIAYPLKLARASRREIDAAVRESAERLGIGKLLGQSPEQLSGGQKQRVAIARGVVKHTDIFILDDPLTGLDFKLREQLFDDFRAMRDELGATFIHATSDTLEAQMLADDILILDGGRIVESGSFETVFERPRHVGSMALLGFPKANLLPGVREVDSVRTACFAVPTDDLETIDDGELQVAVRPEHVRLDPPPGDLLRFDAELTLIENLGGEFVAYLQAADLMLTAVLRHDELKDLVEGSVRVGIAPEHIALYARSDGRRVKRASHAASDGGRGAPASRRVDGGLEERPRG